MMIPVCNPRTWAADVNRSGIQSHSQLHSKLEDSLGFLRSYTRKREIKKERGEGEEKELLK